MVVAFTKLTTKKQVVLTSKIDQLLTMIGIGLRRELMPFERLTTLTLYQQYYAKHLNTLMVVPLTKFTNEMDCFSK